MANRKYCPIHRCENIGECPWCTIVPTIIIPPEKPYEVTERDKVWLRDQCGIDPEK